MERNGLCTSECPVVINTICLLVAIWPDLEYANSNTKTLRAKKNSIRSVWSCSTAILCYARNINTNDEDSGFFLACEDFGERFRRFILRLRFFPFLFFSFLFIYLFFFKVEINSRTPVSFLWPGSVHSGSAS